MSFNVMSLIYCQSLIKTTGAPTAITTFFCSYNTKYSYNQNNNKNWYHNNKKLI